LFHIELPDGNVQRNGKDFDRAVSITNGVLERADQQGLPSDVLTVMKYQKAIALVGRSYAAAGSNRLQDAVDDATAAIEQAKKIDATLAEAKADGPAQKQSNPAPRGSTRSFQNWTDKDSRGINQEMFATTPPHIERTEITYISGKAYSVRCGASAYLNIPYAQFESDCQTALRILKESQAAGSEQVRHLPGMTRAVLRTLRKIWAADFDLAAAGGAGHRRIAEMSLIEARLRSTLASGCDDAARPARRRLETSCGVHHRGDRSRTPMDSSTRPSMLSSPPPIPSDSDVDRRRASCSHSRNIASFSSRDS
jgi:hypothetical protein